MNFVVKTFEELSLVELYEILRVRSEIFVVEQECAYQDIDGIDQRSLHMYLEEDGTILAYLRVFDAEEKNTAQIGRVLSRTHGKGYGGILLRKALEETEARMKPKKMVLEAQCYATGYYQREGFVICSEEFLEDGIPHVRMERICKY